MSYKALVSKIHDIKPIAGADRVVEAKVGDFTIVVGVDTPEGAVGLFFPTDGQLSEEFAVANNLLRKKDAEGNNIGGMFDDNRKVRAQKIRGVKSEGFWVPLSCLGYLGEYDSQGIKFDLKVGDLIDTLDGRPICNKYYTKATRNRMANGERKVKRGETKTFHKHFDTENIKYSWSEIPKGCHLVATLKMHGTSARIGYHKELIPVKLPWYKTLINKFKKVFPTEEMGWTYLNGTRNVIIEKDRATGFYKDDESFRWKVFNDVIPHLQKGMTIYGEIVGYTENNAPIMGVHSTTGLKDKQVTKKFGDSVTYHYNEEPGKCSFYVYRITVTNEDGDEYDLSWQAVKNYCKTHDLNPVPQLDSFWYDGDLDSLKQRVSELVESDCSIYTTHPKEGICIRLDGNQKTKIWKSKSYLFMLLEGLVKEKDDYVDEEEIS